MKLSEADQHLSDLKWYIQEGDKEKSLEFLEMFMDDWKCIKDSLDSFWYDIKRD